MMKEIAKYVVRFGLILILALPLLNHLHGEAGGSNAIETIAYKFTLLALLIGLAELVWAVGFKPQFGKTEVMNSGQLFPVMLFRGLLYGAIIIGGTLGL